MVRRLKEKFTKNGVTYTQIERNEKYAVYECTQQGYGFKNEIITNTYYEVFMLVVRPVNEFNKNLKAFEGYDDYEVYPCDEYFGKFAWCCSNKDRLRSVIKCHF